jgi:hypothetical protein
MYSAEVTQVALATLEPLPPVMLPSVSEVTDD